MEEEILQRKRKLQEIRQKAFRGQRAEGAEAEPNNSTAQESSSNSSSSQQISDPSSIPTQATVAAMVLKSSEDILKEELAAFANAEVNLAPRKINWDLKKQIEPKLEKLQRRTQRSIVEILRQTLSNQSDE